MATYPVVNHETGEQKEVKLSVTEWDKWLEDNPGWVRDWSDPDTCPMATEVGDWRAKLYKTNPGWKEVMGKVKKEAKRNPSIMQKY